MKTLPLSTGRQKAQYRLWISTFPSTWFRYNAALTIWHLTATTWVIPHS